MNKFKKVLATLCLVSVISGSLIVPKKAEAFIFTDWINAALNSITSVNTTALTTKEYILDQVVTLIVKATVKRIVASTVSWINNGFDGGPGFVVDPQTFFKEIADGVAGQLIYNNPNFKFMCSPFRAKVQIAINRAYSQPFGQFQCTLSGVAKNFDGFMQDFSQGGWDSFIQISQNSQNNPIGLYNSWQNQVIQGVDQKLQLKQQELGWNKGLLSFRGPCKKFNEFEDPVASGMTQAQIDAAPCIEEGPINTPGTVIENQLNGVLSSDMQSLISADEINELIGALLGQLTGKILGAGRGLSGGSNFEESSWVATNPEAEVNSGVTPSFACITTDGQSGSSPNTSGVPCTPVLNRNPNTVEVNICTMEDGTLGGTVDNGQNCYYLCEAPNNGDGLFIDDTCVDVNTFGNTGTPPSSNNLTMNQSFPLSYSGETITAPPLDSDCNLADWSQVLNAALNLQATFGTNLDDAVAQVQC